MSVRLRTHAIPLFGTEQTGRLPKAIVALLKVRIGDTHRPPKALSKEVR